MKTLLTGFEPFGDVDVNPSQLIVRLFEEGVGMSCGHDLITEVLPTEFKASGERIVALIQEHGPDAVVCLGARSGVDTICLERVALNLDDCYAPDNAGITMKGEFIVPAAPVAYWSTLPLEIMEQTLRRQEIPVGFSNHAGTFVCNHVFYLSRHIVSGLGERIPCGFIHLPLMRNPPIAQGMGGMPLELMLKAVDSCLSALG